MKHSDAKTYVDWLRALAGYIGKCNSEDDAAYQLDDAEHGISDGDWDELWAANGNATGRALLSARLVDVGGELHVIGLRFDPETGMLIPCRAELASDFVAF